MPWTDLPGDLRKQIEGPHTEGTRSEALFTAVARMIREDYSDSTIVQAVQHGPDFVRKYERRLDHETTRVIQKCRGRYVYDSRLAPAIEITNAPVRIRLKECAELPDRMGAMLDRYAKITGARLQPRVREAAGFHEHMFTAQRSGVLESPCGSGKSTWAIAHIALNADPDRRYIYVVETINALYRAADALEQLTDTPIGRVHGFNRDRCHNLCGAWHNWWECGTSAKSACQECTKNHACPYFNRGTEQKRPILCMTHSGLIRLIEDDSSLLNQACIIVDEGLSPFCTDVFTHAELMNLQRMTHQLDLGRLFPYSRLAHAQDLALWQIDQADTFASRNFVYRDEAQTAEIRTVWDALRKSRALGLRTKDPFKPGAIDHGHETLARLTNMFRPTRQQDATYAFREVHDRDGLRYCVTRQRFSLETNRPYHKLWILNASAQLSPYSYPDDMSVYTCPDLPDNSHLMTIHAVKGNPTITREKANLRLTRLLQQLAPGIRQHSKIMVATNKDGAIEQIEQEIKSLNPDADIVHLTRGRIKGLNEAGDCTLAHLTGMATFNGIDDCALHAALILRRTFPDRPYVFLPDDNPNWPDGKPFMPVMRNLFALRCMDELYQTLFRVCIRNDRPATAIVAVPGPEWLVTLWRTVMPHFQMGTAYKEAESYAEVLAEDPDTGKVASQKVRFNFEMDDLMSGLQTIINMPAGQEIEKKEIAELLGYKEWERNKPRIMSLIGDFFESGRTIRVLRRRAD